MMMMIMYVYMYLVYVCYALSGARVVGLVGRMLVVF